MASLDHRVDLHVQAQLSLAVAAAPLYHCLFALQGSRSDELTLNRKNTDLLNIKVLVGDIVVNEGNL